MDNCRICGHSMPQFQSFCPHCGARQTATITEDTGRKDILSRLKDIIRRVHYELFRSEEPCDAEEEFLLYNPSWSFDDSIPHLESIYNRVRNKDRIRGTMATFYSCAGNERIGLWEPSSTKPLEKLRSSYESRRAEKAEEILSWVSKVRQLGDDEFSPYNEAWAGLDEALDGSLSLYDKGINMDHTYPGGYSDRAHAFQSVADGILWAYGILPYRFLIDADDLLEALCLDSELYKPKGKHVRYGNAELGISIEQEIPDLNFAAEVLWLYEQAVKDYKQALSLDSTDTRSCVGVSYVLRQLGMKSEAVDYLKRALAVLNKAIIADEHDVQSYSERAQVLSELGEIELAILDLERLLTLSTSKFDLDRIKWKIEALRKAKSVKED